MTHPELEPPVDLPLKRGAKGPGVRRVQEWLGLRGHPVAIDGDFGPATHAAAAAFLRADNSGVVDERAWEVLTLPMRSAVAKPPQQLGITLQETLAAHALWHARLFHHAGAREVGGQNRGPWVRLFMGGREGTEWKWCLEGEAEILTEQGWVQFRSLSEDHGRVAQVDTVTGAVNFVKPLQYIRKEHIGNIAHIKNRGIDVVTDEDHRFFGNWGSRASSFRPIKEIGGSGLSIPGCVSSASGSPLSTVELDLLAAYLADGSLQHRDRPTQTVVIQVSRTRKIEVLSSLQPQSIGDRRPYGAERLASKVFRFKMPSWFSEVFSAYKEIRWDWALSLSARQARYFVERYAFWDGSQPRRGSESTTITTSRKQNWDVLTALASLGGLIPTARRVDSHSGFAGGPDLWQITFCPDKQSKTIKRADVEFSRGARTLYCVTVPSGAILVRDRQGNPFVTGNCAGFAGFCLRLAAEETGQPLPFAPSFSVDTIASRALAAGRWREGGKRHQPLEQDRGWLFLVRSSMSGLGQVQRSEERPGSLLLPDYVHVGFVDGALADRFTTIEGNSNDAGSSNGDAVVRRHRGYNRCDFVAI